MEVFEDVTDKDYTTVNDVAISDVITELNNNLGVFLETCENKAATNDNFIKLSNIEVDGNKVLASKFDESIDEIVNNVNAAIQFLNEYVEQVKVNESKIGEQLPPPPTTDDDGQTVLGGNPDSPATNDNAGTFYDPSHAEFFKNISLSDLSTVLSVLTAYADEHQLTVEELLENVQYGEEIKKLLLEQPNISYELREFLESSLPDFLLNDFKIILFDPTMSPQVFNVNSDVTTFFENFVTTSLTKIDGTTTEQLSLDQVLGNSDILKGRLHRLDHYMTNTFSGVQEDRIQEVLLNLYDSGIPIGGNVMIREMLEGDEDCNIFVDFIRGQIDTMAEQNGITYEELLSQDKYKKDLMSIPNNIGKTLSYMEVAARTNDPSYMWPVGVTYVPMEQQTN